MKLVTSLVILFVWKATEGAINNVSLELCCLEGMQWASTDSNRCDNYPSLVAGVSRTDQRQCRTILEVCCMKKKQQTQCKNGKADALGSRRCAIRDDEFGSEQYKECCHCCQLGLSVRNMNGDCDLLKKAKFGGPCDDTFNECCVGQAQNITRTTTTQANDINECEVHAGRLCSQICVNTIGSFRCECYDGYTLNADGTSCSQDQETRLTCDRYNPCQQLCVEDDTGISCACNVGFELTTDKITCQDVNECTSNTAVCPPRYSCVNENGSYRCEVNRQRCPSGTSLNQTTGNCDALCRAGYMYNYGTDQCDDIDECARRINNCTSDQRCENTQGSFVCRRILGCGTGYSLMDETQTCIDIDECVLGTHNCGRGYDCVNVEGSFRCRVKTCPPNFSFSQRTGKCEYIECSRGRRADSRGICVDIDECKDATRCLPTQRCVNTIGSYVCRSLHNCRHGYEPSRSASGQCIDINECTRGSHNCKKDQKCINRPGSFICNCKDGYRLDAQRKCQDINECLRNECPSNAICVNTPGSFTCTCNSGMRKQGRMCVDIDECQDPNRCQHGCTNILGSYHCTCPSGFQLADDKRTCNDIDECQDQNRCQHGCINIVGSYHCTCPSGYQLAGDKRTCRDIDECRAYQSRGRICGGECINTPGSYRCSCPDGWRSIGAGRSCQDIDECAEGTALNCQGPNQMCFNTRGSYKCPSVSCPKGFVRTSLGPGRNSVRCRRISFTCNYGDTECLNLPISYSYNFLSFPPKIKIPSNLFSMSGPQNSGKIFNWKLNVVSARPLRAGVKKVNNGYFHLDERREQAIVALRYQIQGPQDVQLELEMNITDLKTRYTARAVSKIYLYITSNDSV